MRLCRRGWHCSIPALFLLCSCSALLPLYLLLRCFSFSLFLSTALLCSALLFPLCCAPALLSSALFCLCFPFMNLLCSRSPLSSLSVFLSSLSYLLLYLSSFVFNLYPKRRNPVSANSTSGHRTLAPSALGTRRMLLHLSPAPSP